MSVLEELKEKAKQFVFRRQADYQLTFPKGGISSTRVLADLEKFCRANEPTFHQDPYVAARLDGRREVFLRIQHQLRLSQEDLWRIYGKDKP